MEAIYTVSDFFEAYAQALSNYDTKKMASYYAVPCTFLSAETVTVFSQPSKIEGLFNQGTGFYKQFGITLAQAEVRTKRTMARDIVQVKVRWKYFGAANRLCYDCDYEYILKTDKHSKWKIEVVIAVNEKERMEAWMTERTKADKMPL